MVHTRTADGKMSGSDKKSKINEIEPEKLVEVIKDAIRLATEELRNEVSDLKMQVENLTQTNKDLINLLTNGSIKNCQWNARNASNSKQTNNDSVSIFNSDFDDTIIDATQKSIKTHKKEHTNSSKIKQSRHSRINQRIIVGSAQDNGIEGISLNSDNAANESVLAAAPKRAWIYAGRFRRGTTEEAVQLYINKRCPNADAKVEELKNDVNANCSFKINILFDVKDTLYTGNFWPKGVIIKRFQFRNNFRFSKRE